MSERNKNGNDELSDFLRYQENRMTERERNAFERKLQTDPFAAEASEGLEGTDPSIAEKDLAGLSMQIKKRANRKQRVLWYRIAASVAVLMIISAIFIITDKRKHPEQLAYTPADQQTEEIQIIKDKPLTETREPAGLPVEKTHESKKEEIPAENKERMRVAEVAAPDQVYAAEKAMPAKSARARKISDTVMVNEYTPPRPVNGRADFDKYIQDNIGRPDTTTTGQRMVVVLNFNVNADGKIDSIKVIRSPGKIFSDEAIRLIREGPDWKPAEENGKAINDKVRIRIVFK
jgi:TonB family protein